MRSKTLRIARCALLAALAMVLSYIEGWFPPPLAIPLPGVKLGLANIVTLFALYRLGSTDALYILLTRCLLGALFAGNASALLYATLGGLMAWLVMCLLCKVERFSVYGVSVGGAAAHNCGQILAAVLTLGNFAPLSYLPYLLFISVGSGALTGALSAGLLRSAQRIRLEKG